MKGHNSLRAFTLIELLVVIAIIAILAAILFPVFAQAKAATKKTQALSNVKQICLSAILYGADYDDTFVRDHVAGASKTFYWWGSWDGTTLRPEEGLLHPYTRSRGLVADPTLTDRLRAGVGDTGFGYNYAYLSPTDFDSSWNEVPRPVSMTQPEAPAETLFFASSARINNWSTPGSWKLESNPLIDPPSYQYPGVHARHGGGKAVLAWVDGHGTPKSVSYHSGSFGWGLEGAWYLKSELGDMVKAGCELGSPCEDALYDLRED